MIDFHSVDISDIDYVRSFLKCRKSPGCEYSFGNIFAYKANMKIMIADIKDFLVIKCIVGNNNLYLYPVGCSDVKPVLEEIVEDAEFSGGKSCVTGMTKQEAEHFELVFDGKYKPYADRDIFDYVYNSQDLINLSGKKYQPKRNHISFFMRNNNWKYEKITRDNIPECIEMNKAWIESYDPEFRSRLNEEFNIIKLVFDNYETLGFTGGLIRADGKVIAYTMGERLGEKTFCTHFEKAFSDIRGAYPVINQQFAENELSGYKYINREDDVGLENLRKAKLSYHPAFLLEKYVAELN